MACHAIPGAIYRRNGELTMAYTTKHKLARISLATATLIACMAVGLFGQTIAPYTSGSRALVNQTTTSTHIPLEMAEARGWVPIGYARYDVNSTTAKSFASPCSGSGCVTLPAAAKHAIIVVAGAPIRWRDDNYNPTTSDGMPAPAGKEIVIEGSPSWLSRFRFVAATATTAEVNVTYYKNVGE